MQLQQTTCTCGPLAAPPEGSQPSGTLAARRYWLGMYENTLHHIHYNNFKAGTGLRT